MDVDLQTLDGPFASHLHHDLRWDPVGYGQRNECSASGMGTHLVTLADCFLYPILTMVAHDGYLCSYPGKTAESLHMVVHFLKAGQGKMVSSPLQSGRMYFFSLHYS